MSVSEKPEFLVSGERARLFPVLADTSKEGRTLKWTLSSRQKPLFFKL